MKKVSILFLKYNPAMLHRLMLATICNKFVRKLVPLVKLNNELTSFIKEKDAKSGKEIIIPLN